MAPTSTPQKSLALNLEWMRTDVAKIAKDLDRMRYNHGLPDDVGKSTATALHQLEEAERNLKIAAGEQAIEEVMQAQGLAKGD